jgi:hypothetical protein
MGIYDRNNGSLVKLTSFPNGFIINNTEGTTQLVTTLADPKMQNISAIVTLTSADKAEKYTNDVRTDLDVRSILPSLLEDTPLSGSQGRVQDNQDSPPTNEPDQGVDEE